MTLEIDIFGFEEEVSTKKHAVRHDEMACLDDNLVKEYKARISQVIEYAALAYRFQDALKKHEMPKLFGQMGYALSRAGEGEVRFGKAYQDASADLRAAEASAILDGFNVWVSEMKDKDIKISETTKPKYMKAYVDSHEDVMSAVKKEIVLKAMMMSFHNYRKDFQQLISAMKALAYGPRDESYMDGNSVDNSI